MNIPRVLLFLLLLIQGSTVFCQYTVNIIISDIPEAHNKEKIFITGIFNRWNPGDSTSILKKNNSGRYEIQLNNIPAGLFEYKFTRGNWQTLEAMEDGRLVAPRSAIIQADTTIFCKIPVWRDDFPASTASPNLQKLNDSFYIPQLDVYRRIWVYLPEDYSSSNKKYPVLYMHDGQDLFDEATSAGRLGPLEWGVDEMMDQSATPCIVVGIAHHEEKNGRLKEYFVYPNEDFEEVYGASYLQFIVEELKPYIDKNFRTKPSRKYTWMAGGSMGGLITLYAGIMYPDVFGSLGVLSPSIWQDHGNSLSALQNLSNKRKVSRQKYYFYAGDNENRIKPDGSRVQMHIDVSKAVSLLKATANPAMKVVIYPGGRHGAWYWRQAFPEMYRWISEKN